jgi:hypothetical protein
MAGGSRSTSTSTTARRPASFRSRTSLRTTALSGEPPKRPLNWAARRSPPLKLAFSVALVSDSPLKPETMLAAVVDARPFLKGMTSGDDKGGKEPGKDIEADVAANIVSGFNGSRG